MKFGGPTLLTWQTMACSVSNGKSSNLVRRREAVDEDILSSSGVRVKPRWPFTASADMMVFDHNKAGSERYPHGKALTPIQIRSV